MTHFNEIEGIGPSHADWSRSTKNITMWKWSRAENMWSSGSSNPRRCLGSSNT